jgi:pimeloyl-[acyl-carrier protein] synthase
MRTATYIVDPYTYYQQLRSTDPVHWNSALRFWTLTRHEDASAALLHPSLSSRRSELGLAGSPLVARSVYQTVSNWMLRLDPPAHTRLRTSANHAMDANLRQGMQRRIRHTVDGLLDAVVPAREAELISQLAAPLALSGIADLIGISPRDQHQFQNWSDEVAAAVEGEPNTVLMARAQGSITEARGYLSRVLQERRRQSEKDLMSGLLQVTTPEEQLNDEEIIGICMLLLLAGHDTATHLLANGVYALLRNPEQLYALKVQPQLLGSAVEECLRYDSPLQGLLRVATEDLELGGKHIRRGQSVLVWLSAADRDPAQFVAPDRFDIARKNNRHLAFGHGIHRCLGAWLASLMATTLIEGLLERVPALSLAGGGEWHGNILFRSQSALRIRF